MLRADKCLSMWPSRPRLGMELRPQPRRGGNRPTPEDWGATWTPSWPWFALYACHPRTCGKAGKASPGVVCSASCRVRFASRTGYTTHPKGSRLRSFGGRFDIQPIECSIHRVEMGGFLRCTARAPAWSRIATPFRRRRPEHHGRRSIEVISSRGPRGLTNALIVQRATHRSSVIKGGPEIYASEHWRCARGTEQTSLPYRLPGHRSW